jgi:hypothetical protein
MVSPRESIDITQTGSLWADKCIRRADAAAVLPEPQTGMEAGKTAYIRFWVAQFAFENMGSYPEVTGIVAHEVHTELLIMRIETQKLRMPGFSGLQFPTTVE